MNAATLYRLKLEPEDHCEKRRKQKEAGAILTLVIMPYEYPVIE